MDDWPERFKQFFIKEYEDPLEPLAIVDRYFVSLFSNIKDTCLEQILDEPGCLKNPNDNFDGSNVANFLVESNLLLNPDQCRPSNPQFLLRDIPLQEVTRIFLQRINYNYVYFLDKDNRRQLSQILKEEHKRSFWFMQNSIGPALVLQEIKRGKKKFEGRKVGSAEKYFIGSLNHSTELISEAADLFVNPVLPRFMQQLYDLRGQANFWLSKCTLDKQKKREFLNKSILDFTEALKEGIKRHDYSPTILYSKGKSYLGLADCADNQEEEKKYLGGAIACFLPTPLNENLRARKALDCSLAFFRLAKLEEVPEKKKDYLNEGINCSERLISTGNDGKHIRGCLGNLYRERAILQANLPPIDESKVVSDLEKAVENYEESKKLDNKHWKNYGFLADCYLRLSEYHKNDGKKFVQYLGKAVVNAEHSKSQGNVARKHYEQTGEIKFKLASRLSKKDLDLSDSEIIFRKWEKDFQTEKDLLTYLCQSAYGDFQEAIDNSQENQETIGYYNYQGRCQLLEGRVTNSSGKIKEGIQKLEEVALKMGVNKIWSS